jgi:hypothetical protein
MPMNTNQTVVLETQSQRTNGERVSVQKCAVRQTGVTRGEMGASEVPDGCSCTPPRAELEGSQSTPASLPDKAAVECKQYLTFTCIVGGVVVSQQGHEL